jgi:hypothetical protein
MNKTIIDLNEKGTIRSIAGVTTKNEFRGQIIEIKEFLARLER